MNRNSARVETTTEDGQPLKISLRSDDDLYRIGGGQVWIPAVAHDLSYASVL
jgi:hypothetical protein